MFGIMIKEKEVIDMLYEGWYIIECEINPITGKTEVTDDKLLTEEICKEILKQSIWFNEETGKYYFMDFQVGNVWISSINIDYEHKKVKVIIV